jgi:hypothetical protein
MFNTVFCYQSTVFITLDLNLHIQSLPITTIFVRLHTRGEVYSIRISLCDKCQWFSPSILVSFTNITARHGITEMSLLKMALKPNYLDLFFFFSFFVIHCILS